MSGNSSTHKTESIVGCSEIYLAIRINPKLFTLVSGRLCRGGQKAVTFFTKMSPQKNKLYKWKRANRVNCNSSEKKHM